jgi:hypothetical protein
MQNTRLTQVVAGEMSKTKAKTSIPQKACGSVDFDLIYGMKKI